MSEFAELLSKENRGSYNYGKPKIDWILENPTISADSRAHIREALASPGVTSVAIATALAKMGHPVGESSVRRYRKALGVASV